MTVKKTAPKKTAAKVTKTASPSDMMVAFDAKAARETIGLNQSQFWSKVFVTQSGGSRYENERSVPRPVQALLVLAYGTLDEAKMMFDHLRTDPKAEG